MDATGEGLGEQLTLLRPATRRPGPATRRPRPVAAISEDRPVARVVVEVGVPHLDRVFDYTVPQKLHDSTVAGVRCTVRLAGQRVSGFVLERTQTSEHPGALRPLLTVPSPVPVLTAEIAALARRVADENAGTLADVLRLAIPARHARAEKAYLETHPGGAPDAATPPRPAADGWEGSYRGGVALLDRIAAGQCPRAVWTALPGADHWPRATAVAALTALAAGRGALIVVPDLRHVDRVCAALTLADAGDRLVRLTADLGPAARYRAFLRILLGGPTVVVGTRAAAYAPVSNLGLVVCWDDGDTLHAEPRSPYPHVRDILRLRSDLESAAAIFGAHGRTAEAARLLVDHWARPVAAPRDTVRLAAPRVVVAGDDDLRDPAARTARIPSLALRTAREALTDGPVLVLVPRTGYLPGLACQDCRRPARCLSCIGPLVVTGRQGPAACRWCGWSTRTAPWVCRHCADTRLRAVVVGSARTAEEIGRALPGVPVRSSTAATGVLAGVGPEPAVVVATPGAEPVAADGYRAAVLLDGWVFLTRPYLDSGIEALRRWLGAAALVRPDGQVIIVADPAATPVQALVRWDPAGLAARELTERTELGLPPAAVLAEVRGAPDHVAGFLRALRLPPDAEVLGDAEHPPDTRGGDPQRIILVRAATPMPLARAFAQARAVASLARQPVSVRMRSPTV